MKKNTSGLYLCMFEDGTLKVGMGASPKARIITHTGTGACFGIRMVRSDIIECDQIRKSERTLIKWCQDNCQAQTAKEWFKGVDYDNCLAIAREIAISTFGPHQKDGNSERLDGFLRVALGMSVESEAYRKGRMEMLECQIVPMAAINALDILHRRCEDTRMKMHAGAAMPEWYDLMNIMGSWEIEVALSGGKPDPELFRAAADALEAMNEPA